MAGGLPAISGRKLIKILRDDGWIEHRRSRHGIALYKDFPDGRRLTTVQPISRSLAPRTLHSILGPKQTGLGRAGLLRLLA